MTQAVPRNRLAYLGMRAAIASQVAGKLLLLGKDKRAAETALVAVQAATEGAGLLPLNDPRRATFERQAIEAAQLAFHAQAGSSPWRTRGIGAA